MKHTHLMACALAALLAPDATAATARGVVFVDHDRDGVRDAGEPGLAGVAVSNGVDVVVTDGEGRYEVPVNDDCQIFVCKPRGYATPLDEFNKPRFWHTHKPRGSPDEAFLYKGVAPTGPLPASIDFPLEASFEPDRFEVIVIGDPQPYTPDEVDFYAHDVIEDILAKGHHERAAFGISLGDLVGDDLDLFDDLDAVQAMAGVPWRNVYGNHDMNFLSPDDEHADETFERVYGPPTYAFQHGPVHFIVLDNVIWQGFDGYSDSGKPKNGNYRGGLRDDQLTFIENYLRLVPREALVVLAFHIPIEGEGRHRIPEQRRLFEILSGHPNTLSLSGHTHLQRHWFFDSEHGYGAGTRHHHFNAATGSGSWYRGAPDEFGLPHATMRCGAPNGYNIFTFDGNGYTARFQAAGRDASDQMHLWTPVRIEAGAPARLVANVWAGHERDTVRYRVDGGPWRDMRHAVGPDPYLEAIIELEASDDPPRGAPVGEALDSHHLWEASLPSLRAGAHLIEVMTVDLYGRTHTGRRIVRVEAPPD